MPEPKKPLASPSPSLLQRLGVTSIPDPEFDARMNLAKDKMRQEMPNEMAQSSINPTGPFGRVMHGLVQKAIGGVPVATTGPFGGISYNPEVMKGMSQNEIEATLAHELTHVGQYKKTPVMQRLLQSIMPQQEEGLPEETKKSYRMQGYDPAYRGKSTEMEAYQTETNRKVKRGEGFPGYDIQLFPPRKNTNVNTNPTSKTLSKVAGVK